MKTKPTSDSLVQTVYDEAIRIYKDITEKTNYGPEDVDRINDIYDRIIEYYTMAIQLMNVPDKSKSNAVTISKSEFNK